jgi:hypothetical protein
MDFLNHSQPCFVDRFLKAIRGNIIHRPLFWRTAYDLIGSSPVPEFYIWMGTNINHIECAEDDSEQ